MAKCAFCSNDIDPGTGIMYVKKEGKVFFFCKQKCQHLMFKFNKKPVAVTHVRKQKK